MAGPFSEIFRSAPVQTYAGLDLGAITNAFATVRDRYDSNLNKYNTSQQVFNKIDVGDNVEGQAIKQAAIDRANANIQGILDVGDFENAGVQLGAMASDFVGNKELQTVLRGYNEYQQGREYEMANPGSTVNFSNYATHQFKSPDGTITPFKSGVENKLDYTARKLDLIGTVKSLGGSLGLKPVETEGLEHFLKTGDWEGIDPKRGMEIYNQLADYYIDNDMAGQQEYRTLTEANSTNQFGEVMDDAAAREQIRQSIQQLGKGQLGLSTKTRYMEDSLKTEATVRGWGGEGAVPTQYSGFIEQYLNNKSVQMSPKTYKDMTGGTANPENVIVRPASASNINPEEGVQLEARAKVTNLERAFSDITGRDGLNLASLESLVNPGNLQSDGYYVKEDEGQLGSYLRISKSEGDQLMEEARKVVGNNVTAGTAKLLKDTEGLSDKVVQDSADLGLYTKNLGPGTFIPETSGTDNIQGYDVGEGKTQPFLKGTIGWDKGVIMENNNWSEADLNKAVKNGMFKKVTTVGADGSPKDIYGTTSYQPMNMFGEDFGNRFEAAAGTGTKSNQAVVGQPTYYGEQAAIMQDTDKILTDVYGTTDSIQVASQAHNDLVTLNTDISNQYLEKESELFDLISKEYTEEGKVDHLGIREEKRTIYNNFALMAVKAKKMNPNITKEGLADLYGSVITSTLASLKSD